MNAEATGIVTAYHPDDRLAAVVESALLTCSGMCYGYAANTRSWCPPAPRCLSAPEDGFFECAELRALNYVR